MIFRKKALAVMVALCMVATLVPGAVFAGDASDVSARNDGNSGTWEEVRDEQVLQVDKVGVKAEVKLAEGEILSIENSEGCFYECEYFERFDGDFENAGSSGGDAAFIENLALGDKVLRFDLKVTEGKSGNFKVNIIGVNEEVKSLKRGKNYSFKINFEKLTKFKVDFKYGDDINYRMTSSNVSGMFDVYFAGMKSFDNRWQNPEWRDIKVPKGKAYSGIIYATANGSFSGAEKCYLNVGKRVGPGMVKSTKVLKSKGKATVKWSSAINKPTGYKVYKSLDEWGDYKAIGTVSAKKAKVYKESKANKKGSTCYYKVRAYKKVKGKTYWGGFGPVKKIKY